VISESASGIAAVDLTSGRAAWEYTPRQGAHVIQLDFSPRLGRFVALEYAYTDGARLSGPTVTLLHIDTLGSVVFRTAVQDWSEAVFCANAELMLNGLGELYDVHTGELTHVFDFPR
jgi:hypothetical protein